MTKEEKQQVRVLIYRYFKIHTIDSEWLSKHLCPDIILPDDGFILVGLSEIEIDEDSIDFSDINDYVFSGYASGAYTDYTRRNIIYVPVKFGGKVHIQIDNDSEEVTDVIITRIHRTQPIIPK